MKVYVDELKLYGQWRYGKSCHLFPEIRDEAKLESFHVFAESIGMKRQWFQNGIWPHYDLTASRRVLAVKLGAIELTTREYIKWQWAISGKPGYESAIPRMKEIHAIHRLKQGVAKGTVTLR